MVRMWGCDVMKGYLMLRAAVLACLIPLPALAELPMSAKDFEAYVTNKTITYDYGAGLLGGSSICRAAGCAGRLRMTNA